ncbi:MAG: GCN5-related N-acetyltransferase [Firmicutes bacterium]|nr:GCN5-related N-acetyltransferase [Bacillota bacterium]
MQYRVQDNSDNINWQIVCKVLQEAGLAVHSVELTKKAFENSYCIIFVFDKEVLIGVGRAISDGAYQAAIYDIAVLPSYQGKKVGKMIMDEIHKGLQNINSILYASPGKENFYKKLGYSKMCTGMAKFQNEGVMHEKGFID